MILEETFRTRYVKCRSQEHSLTEYHTLITIKLKNTIETDVLFFVKKESAKCERKIFGHLAKSFQLVCQNCILRVQMNILDFQNLFQCQHTSVKNVNSIGEHRVKKKKVPVDRKIFLPYYKYGGKQ